jgi:hypothetical protein
MVLYPLGVSSELTMAWLALSDISFLRPKPPPHSLLRKLFAGTLVYLLCGCLLLLEKHLVGLNLCRYTGFMVLYPLGVSSELTMAWLALQPFKFCGIPLTPTSSCQYPKPHTNPTA